MESSLSVFGLLEQAAGREADKEAIYDLARRMTYGELKREAERLAASLRSLGVAPGDRVAAALPNWHETVVLYFAAARLGAVLVPFNPKYRTHEVRHILQNSGSKLVFVCEEFENVDFLTVRSLVQEIVTVRYRKDGYRSYEDLPASVVSAELPEVAFRPEEDVFCILYTSGTTGAPKGALLTHSALVRSGIAIADSMRCTENDVYLILAPVFHVFGLGCNLLSAVYRGSRMVLLDKFKAGKALDLIQREKVTIQHAVPSMLNLELKDPDFDAYDLSSLRAGMTGAAPCPPETVRGVRERMGMRLSISYGSTETCTVTITEYDDTEPHVLETIGKAVSGAEVRIVGSRRETLPFGETGEIACRGFGVMKGYYGLPEQTREVLDEDGWFYTGDLGSMDGDGYVRYMGRKKELIIRGGFNIYPQEVERLLINHPKVLECAVLGLPDPVMGEIVCAAVKLRPGQQADADEILAYLKPNIAPFKLPSRIVFLDDLPATASGKIQKVKLRDLIREMEAG
ncbi:class I adenylate-forming enzyme family protein [Cohnella caldifontis]|uniref:class I adenylate-forming enzyme family protein n=1 Tax=Cohnella caldifontis TaxID=3027471 RepID=UPI0023EBB572|nr:class I adenylate-forming enzyme family protein [Cohnella sp. YIM B05605]